MSKLSNQDSNEWVLVSQNNLIDSNLVNFLKRNCGNPESLALKLKPFMNSHPALKKSYRNGQLVPLLKRHCGDSKSLAIVLQSLMQPTPIQKKKWYSLWGKKAKKSKKAKKAKKSKKGKK